MSDKGLIFTMKALSPITELCKACGGKGRRIVQIGSRPPKRDKCPDCLGEGRKYVNRHF